MPTWLNTIGCLVLPLHPDNIQPTQTPSLSDTHPHTTIEPKPKQNGLLTVFSSFCPNPPMAPALSSNSFLLSTTPSSRLTTLRNPRLAVSAKRTGPPFRFGKPADDSSAEESPTDDKSSSNPFSFNFGKVSDVKALIPVVASPSTGLSFGSPRRKDPGTVFVAGATGLVGVRIAQTLLREGFTVRAGVADLGAAQELARIAAQYKVSYYATQMWLPSFRVCVVLAQS